MSIYNSYVSLVIDKWHKSTEHGEAVQVFRAISSMSLNIILQCAFSFKSNCQQEKNQHLYILACSQLARHCSDRITNPLYAIDWIYWYTSHGRRMKELCKVVHDYAEKVISERKKVLEITKEHKTKGNAKHDSWTFC